MDWKNSGCKKDEEMIVLTLMVGFDLDCFIFNNLFKFLLRKHFEFKDVKKHVIFKESPATHPFIMEARLLTKWCICAIYNGIFPFLGQFT